MMVTWFMQTLETQVHVFYGNEILLKTLAFICIFSLKYEYLLIWQGKNTVVFIKKNK